MSPVEFKKMSCRPDEFNPCFQTGGGVAILKGGGWGRGGGGGGEVTTSFRIVLTQVLEVLTILDGGTKGFCPLKKRDGGVIGFSHFVGHSPPGN